ncbi:hypothetical protein [Tropicimonas sp. S265A]|uniref:hypothetical protein n=1 Tax=Tropicimonas sp. S265A TaxID=3415134 RepID=UPI003C7E767C
MSDRFLAVLALTAVAGAIIYMMRDKIPVPNVSPERPFIASNDHRVVPSIDNSPTFEVLSRPGAAGPQYFCAAAEYARQVLRAEMTDILVSTTAEGPSRTNPDFRSVMFELRAPEEAPSSGSGITIDISEPRQVRSVAVALQFCR